MESKKTVSKSKPTGRRESAQTPPAPKQIPGDRALAVLIDDKPARHEVSPWSATEAIEVGVHRGGEFAPLDNMIILSLAGDYRRRLDRLERREFCDAVYAVRLVMYRRLKNDFPDCRIDMHIIQPHGDIGVSIDDCPFPYVNDRHVLQQRLDDACRRVADCLGV